MDQRWGSGHKHLLAAIELKSMGSSYGNNTNNRFEEVLGVALDFDMALAAGLFRPTTRRPFLGYCVLLVDSPDAQVPVTVKSPHYEADDTFKGASYKERFKTLCRRLKEKGIYSETALVFTEPQGGAAHGAYEPVSGEGSFRQFCMGLAEHMERVVRGNEEVTVITKAP